ncbi:MAG: class IV adenylate cyclase [Chloroflexi bacterium]|nr:class IV adenylate cyclase [Chloroflexota bacterium]
MRNLELKARLADLAHGEQVARSLGAEARGDLHQIDTYFVTPRGRLKLREINDAGGELIYYDRPEATATRWSDYFVAPVADCAALRDVLGRAYGERVMVEKTRRLYIYRGARIHLDDVARLGAFVEFEVPVATDAEADAQSARAIMRALMDAFHLLDTDAVRASYGELLGGGDL